MDSCNHCNDEEAAVAAFSHCNYEKAAVAVSSTRSDPAILAVECCGSHTAQMEKKVMRAHASNNYMQCTLVEIQQIKQTCN